MKKLLFAIIIIAIALYFVLDQQGGIGWAENHIKTGAAGATQRGLGW